MYRSLENPTNKDLTDIDQQPPRTSTSCCFKALLSISFSINIGFIATAIFFLLLQDNSMPLPPTPPPQYNQSCPYARNNTYTARISNSRMEFAAYDRMEFAAYDVGPTHVKICWPVYPHALRDTAPYGIEVDDWFTFRQSYRTAYSGSSNEFTLTNLLPGQPIHIRLTVSAHVKKGTVSQTSDPVKIWTSNASYCGNVQDLQVLRNASQNDMPDKLQACAFDTPMVPCIVKSLGFTTGCAKCFAAENSCIVSECVMKNKHVCLTKPKGAACKECINQHCMAPTAQCGGLPLWALNITSSPFTPS